MSTSRYSSAGQAHRRATRLAASADAWHHQPDHRADVRLDVPVSVSTASGTGQLIADLAEDLTPLDGVVALCGLTQAAPTAATGRAVVVFTDGHHVAEAKHNSGRVEVWIVTSENLSNRLASMPDRFGAIVASHTTTRGEGFWSAARCGLAHNGFLAVVTSSLNPKSHAELHRRASARGFVYIQHLVAVAGETLNRSVAAAHATPDTHDVSPHQRAHRNVFVFQQVEVES